jgi:hypothetical protein
MNFPSEQEATRAYIACGKVALNWGPVELALENILVVLRRRAGTSDKIWPNGWGHKIKDIKAALARDPSAKAATSGLTPLITSAKKLHELRSNVVHCLCQGSIASGELVFGSSDQRRGVAYTETKLTIAQIEAAADEMRVLREKIIDVLQRLRALG